MSRQLQNRCLEPSEPSCHLQTSQQTGLLSCSHLCREGSAEGRGHIPRGGSADCLDAGCDFSQPYLLPPVSQKVCYPLTDGGWYSLVESCVSLTVRTGKSTF